MTAGLRKRMSAASATPHAESDDNYNLISVLYHALQGADTCAQYLIDANKGDDEELEEFFADARSRQLELAAQARRLLATRLSAESETTLGAADEEAGDGSAPINMA